MWLGSRLFTGGLNSLTTKEEYVVDRSRRRELKDLLTGKRLCFWIRTSPGHTFRALLQPNQEERRLDAKFLSALCVVRP
jgi:hypothetical protein